MGLEDGGQVPKDVRFRCRVQDRVVYLGGRNESGVWIAPRIKETLPNTQ